MSPPQVVKLSTVVSDSATTYDGQEKLKKIVKNQLSLGDSFEITKLLVDITK